MNLKPLANRILVKPHPIKETTDGGLILSEKSKKRQTRGDVVGVGPNVTQVKIGDTVAYGRYTGTDVEDNGVTYTFMMETDVFAVL
jgi:chaperonin GroES